MSDYDPAASLRREVDLFMKTNRFSPATVTNMFVQANLVLRELDATKAEAASWRRVAERLESEQQDAQAEARELREHIRNALALIDDETIGALDQAMTLCRDERVAPLLEYAVPWVKRSAKNLRAAISHPAGDHVRGATQMIEQPAERESLPAKDTMRISFESPACLWHTDCDPKGNGVRGSGVMRVVTDEVDSSRSLLQCLHCGMRGYYPYGAVGERCVEVVGVASESVERESLPLISSALDSPEAAPDKDSLPLMARRDWMPSWAAYAGFGGVWESNAGGLSRPIPAMFKVSMHRIASHDGHGLPVVVREPGMPASSRYCCPSVPVWHFSDLPSWAKLKSGCWVRIEDFDEHAQRGQEGGRDE